MTEPLIWTTKGNLPIAALNYEVKWEDTDDYIKLVETYRLGDEIVKEGAHIYAKRGISTEAVAQSLV